MSAWLKIACEQGIYLAWPNPIIMIDFIYLYRTIPYNTKMLF